MPAPMIGLPTSELFVNRDVRQHKRTVMSELLVTLQLHNLSELRIVKLTDNISRDLLRSHLKIRPAEALHNQGDRGDPITIGIILVAIINNGAVGSMIECIKSYITQEKQLKITVTTPDGLKVEVDSSNVDSEAVHRAINDIARLHYSKGA